MLRQMRAAGKDFQPRGRLTRFAGDDLQPFFDGQPPGDAVVGRFGQADARLLKDFRRRPARFPLAAPQIRRCEKLIDFIAAVDAQNLRRSRRNRQIALVDLFVDIGAPIRSDCRPQHGAHIEAVVH